MHDLIDRKTGKDPTLCDMEILKKALEMYRFTDPEYTFVLKNSVRQLEAAKTLLKIRKMCSLLAGLDHFNMPKMMS